MSPVTLPHRGREVELADPPHHFDRTPLRFGLRVFGTPAAALAAAVGVGLAVDRQGTPLELFGALLAACAGTALVALVRCRAYEVVVGRRWLAGRAGPFRDRVPIAMVETVCGRGPSGWRRLFEGEEVAVRTVHASREIVMPSSNPGELVEAIEEMRDRSRRLSRDEGPGHRPPGRTT